MLSKECWYRPIQRNLHGVGMNVAVPKPRDGSTFGASFRRFLSASRLKPQLDYAKGNPFRGNSKTHRVSGVFVEVGTTQVTRDFGPQFAPGKMQATSGDLHDDERSSRSYVRDSKNKWSFGRFSYFGRAISVATFSNDAIRVRNAPCRVCREYGTVIAFPKRWSMATMSWSWESVYVCSRRR